ncbi:MAG: hypothetical protein M1817_003999 [Caeruleum heppii]|nr:MAG: hypothetical protein M1817_003999 [Caeruleum heppii]
MRVFGFSALAVIVQSLPALAAMVNATGDMPSPDNARPGSGAPSEQGLHSRSFFYVGGQYVVEEGQSRFIDQMYVERLVPAGGVSQSNPMVFFHGGGASGTTWLNTPDDRQGWSSWFLDQGYEVYLVDHTSIARSPRRTNQPARDATSAEVASLVFTKPEERALYPQAVKHTQWPGDGKKGDPIFDAFYKSLGPIVTDFERQQNAMRAAGAALLEQIGESFLVSHSFGGLFPWLIADEVPDMVKGIVSLEPVSPPFESLDGPMPFPARQYGLTDAALTYSPPVNDPKVDLPNEKVGVDRPERRACRLQTAPAKQLVNLKKVPVVVIVGEASIHATYDHCTVDFLVQAGVPTKFIRLEEIGIFGNGHFSFLEKNNIDIAKVAKEWMDEQTKTKDPKAPKPSKS